MISPPVLAACPASGIVIDAQIIVTGTFTPPAWDFVAPSPDIGGAGQTATEFAIAPTGWWLNGSINDSDADYSGAETVTTVNVTAIIGQINFLVKNEAVLTSIDINTVKVMHDSITINGMPALQTFTATSLERVVNNDIDIVTSPALTQIDLSALTTASGNVIASGNASLTSLNVSELTTIGILLEFQQNAVLNIMTVPSLLTVGGDILMNSDGFDQTTVDGWLAAATALDGTGGTTLWTGHTLDLHLGTSSPPSGAGLANKAILEGRSNTVLVNSATGPIVSSVLNQAGTLWQVDDQFGVTGGSNDSLFQVDTVSNDPVQLSITALVPHTSSLGTITAIDQGTKTITVSGDITPNLVAGLSAQIVGSTGNDMTITVASFAPNGGGTDVVINEDIPDPTADGLIDSYGVVSVDGDHVADFTAGVVVVKDNSDGLDGPLYYQTGVTDYDFGGSGKTRLFATDVSEFSAATVDGEVNILGEAAVVIYHMISGGTAFSSGTNVATTAAGASIGTGLTLDITV